jgi:hypothetical protein
MTSHKLITPVCRQHTVGLFFQVCKMWLHHGKTYRALCTCAEEKHGQRLPRSLSTLLYVANEGLHVYALQEALCSTTIDPPYNFWPTWTTLAIGRLENSSACTGSIGRPHVGVYKLSCHGHLQCRPDSYNEDVHDMTVYIFKEIPSQPPDGL